MVFCTNDALVISLLTQPVLAHFEAGPQHDVLQQQRQIDRHIQLVEEIADRSLLALAGRRANDQQIGQLQCDQKGLPDAEECVPGAQGQQDSQVGNCTRLKSPGSKEYVYCITFIY
jgi:hypothetical protein